METDPKAAPSEPPEPPDVADRAWQREYFLRRRLREARIPRRFLTKTFENFKKNDALRRRLVEHFQRYVQSFNFEKKFPPGILMIGPVGCGKSHLAAAILREIIAKGYTGLYYNSPDLLRDIRSTFNLENGRTEDELIEDLTAVDLFVLDDLGAEKVSDFVLDRFYLVVNQRYEVCKPMVVTTNLMEEELRGRLGDRIVSRFLEMCDVVDAFPQEDYRRRHLR